jgi:hypothetical protein
LFAASFRRQNARLFFGRVACLGHPCQKHPSTKTAVRDLRKTKSGRTANLRLPDFRITQCRRQPVIACLRSNFASATSVSLLPRLRIRAITSDRFALLKTSDIFIYHRLTPMDTDS